jgi:OOP family OmpA-OmpF porin
MDALKKPVPGTLVATLVATLAGCGDHKLPPNPVPHADLRRPIPSWFDPNLAFNADSGKTRVYIEGKVVFATNKALLKPESEEVLQKLLAFLQSRPDVTRLRIEGHTDASASDEYNQELSAKRALAVADWLVDRGIDHVRLVAVGFGEKKPLGPNDMAVGRAENRRTEFHVMEVGGRPYGPAASLNGGLVLTVQSAEERARASKPVQVAFDPAPPFQPTGNTIQEVKAVPKQYQDPETKLDLRPGVSDKLQGAPKVALPGEAGAAPAPASSQGADANAPVPVVPK